MESLAKIVGQSPYHFHRVFKAATGLTPKGYADAHRGKRVRDGLKRAGTVTEAIYSAGFNSNGRFYAASDELLGMTPTRLPRRRRRRDDPLRGRRMLARRDPGCGDGQRRLRDHARR